MGWLQNAIRWFLPYEGSFFQLVEDAAEAANRAAILFVELAGTEGDAARMVLIERIRDEEHSADNALHGMADALALTFVTPMDREDLFAVTASFENISDFISATANQLTVHRMGALPAGTVELANTLAKATGLLREAARLVHKGNQTDRIRAICREVHYLEHEADVIFRTRLGDLFGSEKDAIALIKNKEFLEGLEDAVDRCATVARVLEGIILKHG